MSKCKKCGCEIPKNESRIFWGHKVCSSCHAQAISLVIEPIKDEIRKILEQKIPPWNGFPVDRDNPLLCEKCEMATSKLDSYLGFKLCRRCFGIMKTVLNPYIKKEAIRWIKSESYIQKEAIKDELHQQGL